MGNGMNQIPAGTQESGGQSQRIVRNAGLLIGGKTAGDLFTLALFVVFARVYGEEGVGQYAFAVALTGFLAIVTDFGLYNVAVKELSRRPAAFHDTFGVVLLVRFALAGLVILGLVTLSRLLPFDTATLQVILLIGAYQLLFTLLDGFAAAFVARENMRTPALLDFSLRAVTALLAAGLALAGFDLVTAVAAMPAVCVLQIALAWVIVVRRFGKLRYAPYVRRLPEILQAGMPFLIANILRQLATRIDVVLLGLIIGTAAAGLFNVAYRFVFLLMVLAYFGAVALFPVASRLYLTSRPALRELYDQSVGAALLIAIPAACGLWLIAPDLIALLFGPDFAASAGALRLLAPLVVLITLINVLGTFLNACDRQVERTRCQAVAAAANVLGGLALIPPFGIVGAAISTVVAEGLLAALFLARLWPVVGAPRIGYRLSAAVLASLAFTVPLAVAHVPLALTVPLAACIYGAMLLPFGRIRRGEVELLLGLLRARGAVKEGG